MVARDRKANKDDEDDSDDDDAPRKRQREQCRTGVREHLVNAISECILFDVRDVV